MAWLGFRVRVSFRVTVRVSVSLYFTCTMSQISLFKTTHGQTSLTAYFGRYTWAR